MRNDKENPIVNLTFQFALIIVEFSEILEENKKYVLSRQILKSGTSIGANVREAQNAESKSDFVHKIKIAAKEADESEYWLLICKHSARYPNPDNILEKLRQIIKVLSKILSTCKGNPKIEG